MSKHTPGPWKIGIKGGNAGYRVDAGDQPIAEIRYIKGESASRKGIDTEEANARLIAAAPDLLEALQMVVSAADADPSASASEIVNAIDWEMVEAALVKAEK